jgi:hypothetical protein
MKRMSYIQHLDLYRTNKDRMLKATILQTKEHEKKYSSTHQAR